MIELKIALPHPFPPKIHVHPNNCGTKKLYNSKIISFSKIEYISKSIGFSLFPLHTHSTWSESLESR